MTVPSLFVRVKPWVFCPTPLTVAVMIEPAGDPMLGLIELSLGVSEMPPLKRISIPAGVP